ncbi:amidohydrolase family protein [bacterium]|nr:amidohydrolase family protein [bacterium]NUN45597.1 amidohydrolase family protein [bacterium]
MKIHRILPLFTLWIALCDYGHLIAQSYVFNNVNIIPMDSMHILNDYTTVVTDGKIVYIGKDKPTQIPQKAHHINGKGKYLIPGLIDSYAHIHEKNLTLFLANGITTVRNAPGAAFQHALKKLSDGRKLVGPRIYSVGPAMTGSITAYHTQGALANADEARFAVRETKRMGYDAVFSYVTISAEVYKAMLDEAQKLGLPVQGHVPYMVPYKEYTEGSQTSFDNLVGLMNLQTGATYPAERLSQFAEDYKRTGKFVIPTLTIHKARASSGKTDSLKRQLAMNYVMPRQKEYWHLSSHQYVYSGAAEIVKIFHQKGVQLLLGSDGGFHFVVHGFSYMDEIRNFAELGIPNYEILRAGTINAARYLGWEQRIGTIEAGKEADLILLNGNPLEDIGSIADHNGVMIRGVWYSREKLDEMLNLLSKECADMPTTQRMKNFPKPANSYKLQAQYEIYYKSVRCGDEQIFISQKNQTSKILSYNSIDPLCQRNTITEWTFKDQNIQETKVSRTSIEGITEVSMRRNKTHSTVQGEHPIYGPFNFNDSTDTRITGGPNTSINLDVDGVGNYYVMFKFLKPLDIGQSDSVTSKKIELNPEEWGSRSVIGNSWYKVTRVSGNDTDANYKKYEIIQPGFNGSPDFSFKATVTVNNEGLIDQVTFNENVFIKRVQ